MSEEPPKTPEWVKIDRSRHSPTRRRQSGGSKPASAALKVVGMIVLVGAVAYAVRSTNDRPDPNYVKATKLVAGYELGKAEEEKNYNHDVYAQALRLLSQVEPSSSSSEVAQAMRQDLEQRIHGFHKKLEAQETVFAATRRKQRKTEDDVREARRRARMLPVTEYPECEKEETHEH